MIRPSGPPAATPEQSPVLMFNRAGELQGTCGDGLFPNAQSVALDLQSGVLCFADPPTAMPQGQ